MNVGDLGEFGLIERLRKALPPAGDRLVVGPGDDAAVWRSGDGYTIATTDTLVAGVHFLLDKVRWRDVGWKALAVNISDIAAMGGTPMFALVTLMLPPETRVEDIDELYAGLRECADASGLEIAGGDIVSAPVFAITVALTGETSAAADGSPLLLRRDGARPGDAVAVTGTLGGSAGGLRALIDGAPHSDAIDAMIARHMRPWPRVEIGRAALAAGVRCAIDVSDGFVQDLGHMCRPSRIDAEVRLDLLPVNPALAVAYPRDAIALAATGGEDYELILVAPEAIIRSIPPVDDADVTIVGNIVAGDGAVRTFDADGRDVALPASGWDHLKRASDTRT